MDELLSELLVYLRGIRRYRWAVLFVAWLVAIPGWIFVTTLPDRYEASARINIDTNSVLQPLLSGLAIRPDFARRVALMSQTLLSRPNLEKVARMSDLDLGATTDEEKEDLIESLHKDLHLNGDRRNASLYSIAYEHADPESAKRVVQSLINLFVEGALGSKRQQGSEAQKFLNEQILQYEKRLIDEENRLLDFKQRNYDVLAGTEASFTQSLSAAKTTLSAAALDLKVALNRRNAVKKQLAGEAPAIGMEDNSSFPSTYDDRINSLQERLDQLLLKYTERHPNVLAIRRLLEELEEKRKEEQENLQGDEGSAGSALQSNPIYQHLRSALSEAEAQVAGARARVNEYSRRVKALEERVDSSLQYEADMKQLTRNYDAVKKQHATLLSRRETAHLSGEVEKTGDVDFRVVDPPRVPLEPSSPNRLLLNSLVLGVAILAGIAVAVMTSLLRPVFDDGKKLNKVTGLPVLGLVSTVRIRDKTLWERLAIVPYLSLSLFLVAAFVTLNVVQTYGFLSG